MSTPKKLYVVGGDGWTLDDGTGRIVANCGGYTDSMRDTADENRANAARLALCWNTRDEWVQKAQRLAIKVDDLVAALGALVTAVEDDSGDDDAQTAFDTAIGHARAALAAARALVAAVPL